MEEFRVPGPLSRLRRFATHRKGVAIAVPLAAVALAIGTGTAVTAGGMSTACILTDAAGNQNGGWNDPVASPDPRTVERTVGSTRLEVEWQGTSQEYPANAAANCTVTCDKGASAPYRRVLDLIGDNSSGPGTYQDHDNRCLVTRPAALVCREVNSYSSFLDMIWHISVRPV